MKIRNKKLKVLLYFLDLLLFTLGISYFLVKILLLDISNVMLGIVFIVIILLAVYLDFYRPIWTPSQHIKRAEKYANIFQNKSKAIEILKQLLENKKLNHNKQAEILFKIGSLYLEENNRAEANKYYQRGLENLKDEKEKGEYLFDIGEAYGDHELYSEATGYFDLALEIASKHIEEISLYNTTLYRLINTYILDEQKNRAEEIYSKLLDKKVIKRNKKVEELLQKETL